MQRLTQYRGAYACLLVILLTSCSGHEAKVTFYTFFFFVIFIILCLPGLILSLVSRETQSRGAKVTSIVFTSVGGFFALIYTANLSEDFYGMRLDEELIIYLLIMWGALISSMLLLLVPKENINSKNRTPYNKDFESDFTSTKTSTNPSRNKPALSESENLENDIDMSGLDDLADL